MLPSLFYVASLCSGLKRDFAAIFSINIPEKLPKNDTKHGMSYQ